MIEIVAVASPHDTVRHHVFTEFDQRRRSGWIGCRPRGRRERIGRSGGIAEREHPVKPSQFKGAVVADAVQTEVGHGVARDHCHDKRCSGNREGVLGPALVGCADCADGLIRPRLRTNPRGRVEPVIRIAVEQAPMSLGPIPSTDFLHHNRITAPHEGFRERLTANILAVRRA